MQVLVLLAALLIISVMMSTPEQRARARERLKPISRKLILPVVALWGWIIFELWRGSGK